MKCPFCKTDKDRVVDSRSANEGATIRRRRECLACGRRFTTYERLDEYPMRVVKKDGTRVAFNPDKIMAGVQRACEKRPISPEQIEALVREVEQGVSANFDREVPSMEIGELVMKALRGIDDVAYVRFASVYREFKDAQDFVNVMKE